MKTDVFRFTSVRSGATVDREDESVVLRGTRTRLGQALADARQSPEPFDEMRKVALQFADTAPAAGGYLSRLSDLDPAMAPFNDIDASSSGFKDAVEAIAKVSPATLETWASRIEDSLTVALILSEKRQRDAKALDRTRRLLGVVQSFQAQDKRRRTVADKDYDRILLLDPGVFPVPGPRLHSKATAAELEARRKRQKERQETRDGLVKEIRDNQVAIKELTEAYDADYALSLSTQGNAPPPAPPPDSGSAGPGFLARLFGRTPDADRITPTPSTRLGILPQALTAGLSEASLNAARRLGLPPNEINVPLAVAAIERRNATLAKTLYSGGLSGRAMKLAGGFVPPDVFGGNAGLVAGDDFDVHVPGACPLPEVEEDVVAETSVPSGVGEILSLGVSDLMVTKQRLLRYEMGEVAHIENVMKSEKRTREHRVLTRSEVRITDETEVTEENERDLETTERFELQTESQKTIQEDASRQAGVTLSGSYGPSVEFSANVGFTSSTSKASSVSTATAHAREITERSVNRIQERVRRERATVTINEVEVINTHGFENQAPTAVHINGIYRWVDKIYEAQVYNYGKRELIEVVVPEPALLLRYLTSAAPREGITVPRPEDPGYCSSAGDSFEPLEPKHLNSVSALFWASMYNVAGINPPPPRFQSIGVALATKSDEEHPKEAQADNSLKVPSGYAAKRGVFKGNLLSFTNQPGAQMEVYIGRHHAPTSQLVTLNGETDVVPVSILSARSPGFAGNVEVECESTPEYYAAWQLETYNAIITAYEERRAAYDAALADSTVEEETSTFRGRNPIANRQIERREIKRCAISQITGQHFDDFDAMRRSVGALGYPQADLNEARLEGQYIRFIEQAFEWENMQYLFYPYFWGRKDGWPAASQITDVDPLFEAFMTTGAARVNVPVRPGFEAAVNAFLSTGQLPWNADDGTPTVVGSEPFISIADEMKAQSGAVDVKSGGRVSVSPGSRQVTGTGTDFTEDDADREITLGGAVYMIASVEDTDALTLESDYLGAALASAVYSIGAKAVGVPWTVRIPTSLVMLQATADLPDFSAAGSGGP
jgi:hypothetical protein